MISNTKTSISGSGVQLSCVYDGDMVLQKDEVESGAFLNIEEVLRLTESQPFTPDGLYVLRRYLTTESIK